MARVVKQWTRSTAKLSNAAARIEDEMPTFSPEDLAFALPGGLAMYHTSGLWKYGPHHKHIEDQLILVEQQPIRLLLSIPPRHGKSMLASIYFSAWYLMRNPTKRIMFISHGEEFATREVSRPVRNIVKELGPSIFGSEIDPESTSIKSWNMKAGGGFFAAGIDGSIVGRGADILLFDDVIKGREQALSARYLEELQDRYGADIYPRLQPNSSIIGIGTRWASDDLIGYLIKKMNDGGDYFHVIDYPALAEDENDPLGREPGEALWPEHLSREQLLKIKANIPAFWWNAEFQQRPAPREGYLINVGKFRYYDAPPKEFDLVVISWDTAYKEKEVNDPTVAGVWGFKEGHSYLLDVVRERMPMPKLQEMVEVMNRGWKPNVHLVEDKGSGISLIQWMQENSYRVEPIEPENSKVFRMEAETPQINAGTVHLPNNEENNPWVKGYLEELQQFPSGPHDDQVDMTSQFLKWVREKNMTEPFDVW